MKRFGQLVRFCSAIVVIALLIAPPAYSADGLVGAWTVTITVPSAPGSQQTVTSTVTFNVTARGKALVGRMTITDDQNRTVAGVWREVGKSISITYEPFCDPSSPGPCATILLTGKVKAAAGVIKGSKAIVIWDTPNSRNPALFSTSEGTFSAVVAAQ